MEIEVKKSATVKAKALKLNLCVRDSFCATLHAEDGSEICEQEDDYVPDFMPGEHYGDYVELEIDIETGQILNWDVDADLVAEWVNKCNDSNDED